MIKRIETAIDMLNDGLPYQVGELYMGIDERGYLNITMASLYVDLKNVSKVGALRELDEIKLLFSEMKAVSINLKSLAESKLVKYNLDFYYGMGDVRICSEINGLIDWQIDFN